MKEIPLVTLLLFALILAGCGSTNVEVVDLDKVLDTFVATADAMPVEGDSQGLAPDASAAVMQDFAARWRDALNALPLASRKVGIQLRDDGSFLGFVDADDDNAQGSGEQSLFSVELDHDRNRLIASDLQHSYHRSHGYHGMGSGFLTGMLVSSLFRRQSAAGISPSRHANTQVAPRGYHSQAQQRVRASARARSSSGSRSFRVGK